MLNLPKTGFAQSFMRHWQRLSLLAKMKYKVSEKLGNVGAGGDNKIV